MASASVNGSLQVPDWIVEENFESVLRENVAGFQRIKNFKVTPAMSAGENYSTVVLRVEIDVNLEGEKSKCISFILKTPVDNPVSRELMKKHNMFVIEQGMYLDVVHEMEEMFRDAGLEVKFGPQCFQLETGRNDYLMLEDLRPRGFKNANRLEGLDMEHTKCVLKKLAQWHAASATRVDTRGKYAENYTVGFFTETHKPLMKTIYEGASEPLIKCLKSYAGFEEYGEKVLKIRSQIVDEILKMGKVDSSEFNVLNHGDCWSNNIMFQYDAFGNIKETYFVDYQIPKYGSPAQDLFYFLLSSTNIEIKLKHFEFFIKFYYDNLIEALQLLKYPKLLPRLKDIHAMLYKYGIWGFNTAIGTMPGVLLDPTESASFENIISNDEAAVNFKMQLFSNPRYRQHIEAILPWLYNRGALECS